MVSSNRLRQLHLISDKDDIFRCWCHACHIGYTDLSRLVDEKIIDPVGGSFAAEKP